MKDKDSSLAEWLLVVNPNAGNGKGKKEWDAISSALKKRNIEFDFRFTSAKGDATSIIVKAVKDGYKKFITIGGDGTLNEVLNGVFTSGIADTSLYTLALIPVGTGNDWGRLFGIPLDHNRAAEIIKEEKTLLHDVGIIDYHDGNEKKRRYFINISGFGFEAAVVKRTNHQKDKGRGGKLIYLYSLLLSLLRYRNTMAELEIDGITRNERVFSVSVGNGKYCGGGMRQTPDAVPTDGLLDVTVIKDISKTEIIRRLKILYDGTILEHPLIDGYRCRNLKARSGSVIYTEADGESLGHTPVEFSILPSAIKIVYGVKVIQ